MSKRNAVLGILVASVLIVPASVYSQTIRDFEGLFSQVAGNLQNALEGSIALWRVDISPDARGVLSDEAIGTALDLELDFSLADVASLDYRYQESLKQDIQLQTVMNVLAYDRIDVAQARQFGLRQNLDFLLDIRVRTVNGALRVEYRVLRLENGSLATAGFVGALDPVGDALRRAAETVMEGIRPGDLVMPLSVIQYDADVRISERQQDLVTLTIGASHPGRVFDFRYLEQHLLRGLGEEEEAILTDVSRRVVSSQFQRYLGTIGVNLVLTATTGPDGTVAKLVDVRTGVIRRSAVVETGMLRTVGAFAGADLASLRRNSARIGTVALVQADFSNPTGAFSSTGAAVRAHAERRRLLSDYIEHVLSEQGLSVRDQYFVQHRRLMEGIRPGSYFDQAWRREFAAKVDVSTMYRIDVIQDQIGVSLIDAQSLQVHSILSPSESPGIAGFSRWFAEQYSQSTSAGKPLLIHTLDTGREGDQATSYPFLMLLVGREMLRYGAVIDPAFGRHLAATEFGGIPLDSLTNRELTQFARLGVPDAVMVELGTVAYRDSTQFFGRALDTRTRFWELVRIRYEDTAAQQIVRDAFAGTLGPLPDGRTGAYHYQNLGASSLSNDHRRSLGVMIQALLSSEKKWRIAHSARPGSVDYDVIFDDFTRAEADVEMFLRVLSSPSGQVVAVSNVAVSDRVRQYDLRGMTDIVSKMSAATGRLLPRNTPVTVLVPTGLAGESPALITNGIKQTLFEMGHDLVDTVGPNTLNNYDENNLVFELGAGAFAYPLEYTHGNGIKVFDSAGFLVGLQQWSEQPFYDVLVGFDKLPALTSATTGLIELSITTPYESIELDRSFVRDSLLGSIIRSGGTQVIDPSLSTVFLHDADKAQFLVEGRLIDNPVLYSINPSLYLVTRRARDDRWFHVAEIPVPGTIYTVNPGSYVPTMLDEFSTRAAGFISERVRHHNLGRSMSISLAPDRFILEEEPNRILYEKYEDPQFVLAAKLAAELYRQMPETTIHVVRQSGLTDNTMIIPEINIQEWEETFREPASYTRDYRIALVLTRGQERIGIDRIDPDTRESIFPPDQLLRAGQLKALSQLTQLIANAVNYADNSRVVDLKDALDQMNPLLPGIILFPGAHTWASGEVAVLEKRLEELSDASTAQSIASQAIVLIGNGEYREARNVLRSAIRDLGEVDVLVGLLQRSEDLPRGIVGRVPSTAVTLESVIPINNESFTEFTVAGRFSAHDQTLFTRVFVRPNGVYRIRTRGSVAVMHQNTTADGTRILKGNAEYVLIADSGVPVDLAITNTGRRATGSFRIAFERDNEALYRETDTKGALAQTMPETGGGVEAILALDADAAAYRRHRIMRSGGWISTGLSVLSFTVAGTAYYVDQTDAFGYHDDYDRAKADYSVAITTAAAVNAARRAEAAEEDQARVRQVFYGGLIAGGVSAVSATLFFLLDRGYPSLETDGPLFGFGLDPATGALVLNWTYALGR